MRISLIAFLLACFFLTITHIYYPKWQKSGSEATLSWDVSGYYMYLPAIFIYKDLKGCSFKDDIISKYQPSPQFDQAFLHESGNYVMKYPLGQAIQYTPFFFIAHTWATFSEKHEPDGFSFPYQLLISIEALLVAFLGMWMSRKILLFYFKEKVVALSILLILLGTNYLNYAAIDGGMTHNNLFTIYAILIYYTILFYKKPTYKSAIIIGICSGLAALTRPTEAISIIIPLLWGVNLLSTASIKERISLFISEKSKFILSALIFGSFGFLQLLYWKYATGDWIVYSYQDQGFSWLSPHFKGVLISYQTGWLLYSPIMIFSLIGFYYLWKNKQNIFWATAIFSLIFIYLACAWDIWWYGGSIGIRAMIQAYPILLFPLAAFVDFLFKMSKPYKYSIYVIFTVFVYFSLWFTHQAHNGGMLYVGQMTKTYFWKTLGTYTPIRENLKYLDHNELFDGIRDNVKIIYQNGFDTFPNQQIKLNNINKWSQSFNCSPKEDFEWIRVYSDFTAPQKEWNTWIMRQFYVTFYDGDNKVKVKMFRPDRLLDSGVKKQLYFDIKKPKVKYTSIGVSYYNDASNTEIFIDNLKIESFN